MIREHERDKIYYYRHLSGATYEGIAWADNISSTRVSQLIHRYLRWLASQNDGTETVCPGCGANLIHYGWWFDDTWRCSNYPRCGYRRRVVTDNSE